MNNTFVLGTVAAFTLGLCAGAYLGVALPDKMPCAAAPAIQARATHLLGGVHPAPVIGHSGQVMPDKTDPYSREVASFGDNGGQSVFVVKKEWYGMNTLVEMQPFKTVGSVYIDPADGWTIIVCGGAGKYRVGIQ